MADFNIKRRILIIGFLMAGLAGANAEGNHKHGSPANGGQLVEIGGLEAEITVKGQDVTLYLTEDHDKKVDAKSYSAILTVLAKGNEQKTVTLAFKNGNQLAGNYDFQVEGRFRASILLKKDDKDIGKGRYNLELKK
ncbi:MAG: hypothetical protein BGP06_19580 [Rhizobiales bacterium 65-9]|nr:MAG: hypothetical protein BGP06_19580 [Rhizobiales bacterium 65-9]